MEINLTKMSDESLGRQIQLTRKTLDHIREELGAATKRLSSATDVTSRSLARKDLEAIDQRGRETRCELKELQNEYARRIRVWLESD